MSEKRNKYDREFREGAVRIVNETNKGPHRDRAEHPLGGRHDRDSHRGRKLYLATVIDLYSRRLLGAATGLHPDVDLARQAITMAVAARGGAEQIRGVIFHTDRARTYTADPHHALPPAQDQPVDGPGWVVLRQRRRRGVLLQPGMGGPVPT